MSLEQRLKDVERRIADACARCGRDPGSVNVVAVTKYVSANTARLAVEAGMRHIGENRWPAAEEKWRLLEGKAVFHYIGSLQSRKVKDVVGKFDYIHSIDRLSLAEEIHKRAEALGIRVPCFLQANVSGEDSKHGLAPDEMSAFVGAVGKLKGIRPVGLMTMAQIADDAEATRPVFRGLRTLRDEINGLRLLDEPLTELSMGMSGDFEVAIEEGATWVRLGSVLVGHEEIEG
ncbi:YggS family pyridoxal phosphate-dependent enzyme [Cohnella sp. JJ-181]|uniref:YggS family pyridoxal phosphate-dependent enzyme n=1 Tax=Cohnella rhizoplanae TaxID=2974897 RepID=UPI0022FFAC55|nr:YggS family pyridoxal phosphate-dependent enzyme [Cohnella sp. JJ-181]CAI6020536.1 Pyridoxal phosphate homeostasis protein [Cohnella sp. JJ-181]